VSTLYLKVLNGNELIADGTAVAAYAASLFKVNPRGPAPGGASAAATGTTTSGLCSLSISPTSDWYIQVIDTAGNYRWFPLNGVVGSSSGAPAVLRCPYIAGATKSTGTDFVLIDSADGAIGTSFSCTDARLQTYRTIDIIGTLSENGSSGGTDNLKMVLTGSVGGQTCRYAEWLSHNATLYYLGVDSAFSMTGTPLIGLPDLNRGSATDGFSSSFGVINISGNVHSVDDLPTPFRITYDQGNRSGNSSFNCVWGSAQNGAGLSIGHMVVSYNDVMNGFEITTPTGGSLTGQISVYGMGFV